MWIKCNSLWLCEQLGDLCIEKRWSIVTGGLPTLGSSSLAAGSWWALIHCWSWKKSSVLTMVAVSANLQFVKNWVVCRNLAFLHTNSVPCYIWSMFMDWLKKEDVFLDSTVQMRDNTQKHLQNTSNLFLFSSSPGLCHVWHSAPLTQSEKKVCMGSTHCLSGAICARAT